MASPVQPFRSHSVDTTLIGEVLLEALQRGGSITITHADLPDGLMGRCTFDQNLIELDRSLSASETRTTLCHELVHLGRGPVLGCQVEQEEMEVEQRTAEVLIPQGSALAALDRQWTMSEIQLMANAYGVDTELMSCVLDTDAPLAPTIPFQRDRELDVVRIAAREANEARGSASA